MSAESLSLRRSSPPLDAGRVLAGKFEICGVLGDGASGIVYDARRLNGESGEDDKARVALKVLHPHLVGDEQLRGRFRREVAILQRLSGPHLCPVLDFGEAVDPRSADSKLVYMALPKVAGPSLERLITSEGSLPLEQVIDIGLQIGEGLQSAHRQGVIHRDLKPANVLMRDGHHAVVVDFGLAKILAGEGGTGTTALTAHNMVFGTPEYMSPEQARGEEVDARCDLYALGIILYQLVTGKVPFTGASPLSILTAHMTVEPELLRERVPERGVSAALEAVVHHLLAKNPDDRYASADAVSTALGHARIYPTESLAVAPARIHARGENGAEAMPTMPSAILSPVSRGSEPGGSPGARSPDSSDGVASDGSMSGPASPARASGESSPGSGRGSGPSMPSPSSRSRTKKPFRSPYRSGPPSVRPPPVAAPISNKGASRDAEPILGGPRWVALWIMATAIGVAVGVWLSLRQP